MATFSTLNETNGKETILRTTIAHIRLLYPHTHTPSPEHTHTHTRTHTHIRTRKYTHTQRHNCVTAKNIYIRNVLSVVQWQFGDLFKIE